MTKLYKSVRKLESLPEGSQVIFSGRWGRWTKKRDGSWVIPSYRTPFSSESLTHYNNGEYYEIVEPKPNAGINIVEE